MPEYTAFTGSVFSSFNWNVMKRYIWFNKETAEYFFNTVQEEFHKHNYLPHGTHSKKKLNFWQLKTKMRML